MRVHTDARVVVLESDGGVVAGGGAGLRGLVCVRVLVGSDAVGAAEHLHLLGDGARELEVALHEARQLVHPPLLLLQLVAQRAHRVGALFAAGAAAAAHAALQQQPVARDARAQKTTQPPHKLNRTVQTYS